MAVETSDLEQFAVEIEPVLSEFAGPEARPVNDGLCAESHGDGIEIGVVHVPQRGLAAIEQRMCLVAVRDYVRFGDLRTCGVRYDHVDRSAVRGSVKSQLDVEFGRSQHVSGGQTHVLAIHAVVNVQIYLAVYAAVDQIVHHAAERGYLRPLGAVYHYGDDVFLAVLDVGGDVTVEFGITSFVRESLLTVDVDVGIVGYRLETENEFLSLPACGNVHRLAVTADELIRLFVEVVVGYFLVGVRDVDRLERGIVEVRGKIFLLKIGGIFPTVIQIDRL